MEGAFSGNLIKGDGFFVNFFKITLIFSSIIKKKMLGMYSKDYCGMMRK